jgi:Tat protein secretion system quality control protein TatD with DNase activity
MSFPENGGAKPQSPHIVDIGVNLAHRSFHKDRAQVIQRAFEAGVRTMITTGTSLPVSREAVQLARGYPGQLFATAGVHPHDSRNCTDPTIPDLRHLAGSNLDLGLHIGITGWICDERRGTHLREVVREIPLDRLMIETDAPFLLPRSIPARPKDGRNEPAFLPYVLQTIADCLGQPPERIADATTATAIKLFTLHHG